MQVQRLMSALYLVWRDFEDLEIQKKLTALSAASQALLASPSDIGASDTFSRSAETLEETLPDAQANEAPGSVRLALGEAGLDLLIGTNLSERVREILGASPFLLPQASQAIQALEKKVKQDIARVNNVLVGLENLKFQASATTQDVYEIGILMPSQVVKEDLRVIQRELDEWVFVINHIQELVTGQPAATIPVHSISSGSLDLFCGFHATGAEAMMILTLGAYSILQYARDAAKRRKELEELKYPSSVIEPMAKHEKALIEKGKSEIIERLLAKKSDALASNRDHELRTALKHVVEFVLRRVNEGVDVEVSVPPEAEEQEQGAKAEVKQLRAAIEQMRLDMRKIASSLPDRTTPVLQLPDPSEETPASQGGNGEPTPSKETRAAKRSSKAAKN